MREMLDKLNLSLLFCFFAANPIAMMNVFAPQTLVIRACTVVEIPDFLFVVIASHAFAVLSPGKSIRSSPVPAAYVTPRQVLEVALQTGRILVRRPNWYTICARKCASVQAL